MVGKFKLLFVFVFPSLLSGGYATAEVMFEGYSIVRSGSKAIGYTVQRYEFDAKKKQFTATSFLKTSAGGELTESLKAVANDKFQPISYQYVTKTGDNAKMIDVKFKGDQMTGNLTEGKKTIPVTSKIKKGTFLSSFLGYLMLQNGLKPDKKFVYSAIAEEDGTAYSGEALIKTQEDYKGQQAYRVVNVFKGVDFVSFLSAKGEVLGTTSPKQNISTELVANPAEATKGFLVPADTLKILFGTVPTGKVNVLAAKLNTLQGAPTASSIPAAPVKNEGSTASTAKKPSPAAPQVPPAKTEASTADL